MDILAGAGVIALSVVLAGLLAALGVHGYFMLRNRVPYVVLPDGALPEVIRELGIKDGDVVYDLGSGDGRVIMALREHNKRARYVGIENDWVVWLTARLRGSGYRLVLGEISRAMLGEATRVYAYLGPQMMAELEPRFEKELPAGARVVSVQFPLPGRAPDQVVELPDSAKHAACLYVYNY
jgi:hypothetical protein